LTRGRTSLRYASPMAGPDRNRRRWLTPPVAGIGAASLLSDAGHEIPTALLPSFLVSTLGAPAAALGLIEGMADGLSGMARLAGGALADDPHRRREIAIGGYATTAVISGLIGIATSVWQVGVLRVGAWVARGLRVPSRNALLADATPPETYGRAYGFERAMDNLGAIIGPLLALVLVALVGIRSAILISVIPGLLAAGAIMFAIKRLPRLQRRDRQRLKLRVRETLTGPLRRIMVGISAFELGNLAATLMILRATELLAPSHGTRGATELAILLYVSYNLAATLASIPAGRMADRRGSIRVLRLGVALFGASYAGFAVSGPNLLVLLIVFVVAGVAIGCVETAEHSTVASLSATEARGSAFGILAGVQSFGNLAASSIAGVLWTVVSASTAFWYAATWMLIALISLALPPTGKETLDRSSQ